MYKGLLNEFSTKPYISMSHQLYPIDNEEEEDRENSYESSGGAFSSSDDEEEEEKSTDIKKRKG